LIYATTKEGFLPLNLGIVGATTGLDPCDSSFGWEDSPISNWELQGISSTHILMQPPFSSTTGEGGPQDLTEFIDFLLAPTNHTGCGEAVIGAEHITPKASEEKGPSLGGDRTITVNKKYSLCQKQNKCIKSKGKEIKLVLGIDNNVPHVVEMGEIFVVG
jgi:hypothetical protein